MVYFGKRKGVTEVRHDCHMHMVLDGVDWRNAIRRHSAQIRENWIRQQLSTYRELGFGDLRDGGDRWGVGAKARELAAEFRWENLRKEDIYLDISTLLR